MSLLQELMIKYGNRFVDQEIRLCDLIGEYVASRRTTLMFGDALNALHDKQADSMSLPNSAYKIKLCDTDNTHRTLYAVSLNGSAPWLPKKTDLSSNEWKIQ